jgi:hypothetical protein
MLTRSCFKMGGRASLPAGVACVSSIHTDVGIEQPSRPTLTATGRNVAANGPRLENKKYLTIRRHTAIDRVGDLAQLVERMLSMYKVTRSIRVVST